jgi:hypothetical protein
VLAIAGTKSKSMRDSNGSIEAIFRRRLLTICSKTNFIFVPSELSNFRTMIEESPQ